MSTFAYDFSSVVEAAASPEFVSELRYSLSPTALAVANAQLAAISAASALPASEGFGPAGPRGVSSSGGSTLFAGLAPVVSPALQQRIQAEQQLAEARRKGGSSMLLPTALTIAPGPSGGPSLPGSIAGEVLGPFNPAPIFDFDPFPEVPISGGNLPAPEDVLGFLKGGFPSESPTGSAGAPPITGGGGFTDLLFDILRTGVQNAPAILRVLADAGVVRGSVGQAFATPAPAAPEMSMPTGGGAAGVNQIARALAALNARGIPATAADFVQLSEGQSFAGTIAAIVRRYLPEIVAGAAGSAVGGMLGGEGGVDEQTLVDQVLGLFGGNGGGGGVASCPSLFRMRKQGSYLPSRIQVMGPDGNVYVLANLGRATRGSRETSVLKRLAKDNGYVTRRRSSGGR